MKSQNKSGLKNLLIFSCFLAVWFGAMWLVWAVTGSYRHTPTYTAKFDTSGGYKIGFDTTRTDTLEYLPNGRIPANNLEGDR